MDVTIEPAVVTAMGNVARHVGETMIGVVPRDLADAQGDAAAARIRELASSGQLDACLSTWTDVGTGMRDKTVSTGDKLLASVHVYVTSDHQSADLFRATPVYGEARPV